ncbi:RNase HI [Sinobaca qinghaiensis]|uniref:RNase HI n=1 Tax=Sinobaca qinghaiensis TaxID=342944 RepID=A0A419UWF6_9BACL|nr:reverse transcriptase-like protein [Sinobaca qinghaiensis]RKD69472.1 RNase HI [Sinobaca qinghaiensis]
MNTIYIDGASAGSPGYSGAGIHIKPGGGGAESLAVPLGIRTNHEAEFMALRLALVYCVEQGWESAVICTDSQVVDDAVAKRYVKNPVFASLLQESLLILEEHPLYFIKWIPSSKNKAADQLSKQAVLEEKRKHYA